jgi:hypothetical protein
VVVHWTGYAIVNVNSEQEFMRAGKRSSFKGKGAVRNFFADAKDSQVQREASDLIPLVKECCKDKGRCEINCFVLSYRFVRL